MREFSPVNTDMAVWELSLVLADMVLWEHFTNVVVGVCPSVLTNLEVKEW